MEKLCVVGRQKKPEIPASADLRDVDIILQRLMPSKRKSAKWGVQAIKPHFQDWKFNFQQMSRNEKD